MNTSDGRARSPLPIVSSCCRYGRSAGRGGGGATATTTDSPSEHWTTVFRTFADIFLLCST